MKHAIALFISAFLLSLHTGSFADDKSTNVQSGEALYNQLCVNCHAGGIDNAPKLGAKDDWKKRLPLGLQTLYMSVIEGPNHMYSKGNSPIESEAEIKSMITHMMNSVIDDENHEQVNSATPEIKDRHLRLTRGYKWYDQVCFDCHNQENASLGAPRIGIKEDWISRKEMGISQLTESIIKGKGHMYMRAMTANQSEEHFRNMVEYMLSTVEDSE